LKFTERKISSTCILEDLFVSKVVILAGDFPPIEGGISIILQTLARLLSPDEVVVIGLPTPGSFDFDKKQDYKIIRLPIPERWGPKSRQFKFLAPFYFWELIKEANIDYIICGQSHHSLFLPAWLSRKIKGVPFCVIAYGNDISSFKVLFYKRILIALLRSAQAVIAISRKTSEVVKKTGVRPELIHIINPMVDMTMQTGEVSPNKIRQTFSLEGKKCLLTVCRLVERKGVDTVIRAMPEILKMIPEAHYLIVGSGPFEHELKKLTQKLGLESHVTFVGYVAHEDVSPYYAMCDVFVMISRDLLDETDMEGFGLVFLEANLFGKPVIAGRSGGIADAVLDGQTGVMVDPGNPSAVAGAVVRLLTDEVLSHQLGETGRIRVLEQFSGQSAIHKIREVITNGLNT
jgi:phosphatidyl-myo-inositol dimannoside synthase